MAASVQSRYLLYIIILKIILKIRKNHVLFALYFINKTQYFCSLILLLYTDFREYNQAILGECQPTLQVGSFMKSSKSQVYFPQQVQYFFRSWKTGFPLWYLQAYQLFSLSRKSFKHPLLMHLNLPYFVTTSFFSVFGFYSTFFFCYCSALRGKYLCCID